MYEGVFVKLRFGTAVKKIRSEMGISQEKLAYRAGLHRTYICDIERGERNPSLESIGKLARALGTSLPVLFERATGLSAKDEMMQILLVEDDPRDIELTIRAFKKARISNPVKVLRDGAEALDFIFESGSSAGWRDSPGQVILLDLNLPKIRGLEVLLRLKADRRTQNIPVVILTVSSQDQDIEACRRLGADSYIIKPVGFRNFSEIMPRLQFDWALIKGARRHLPGNIS